MPANQQRGVNQIGYRQDLFVFALNQIRNGKAQEEFSEALNQLVNECRETGKKGDLVVTISVRPDKGDNGQYFIRAEHKLKSPKLERGDTIFWGTPEGNLQRTDPAQGDLDLRVAPRTPVPIKLQDEPPSTVKTVS